MVTKNELYLRVLDKWGIEAQLDMLVEECSEVIKEVCKRKRGRNNKVALVEELADLDIMLDQFKMIWGLNIETIKELKLNRLEKLLLETGG